jgi:Fur family transcriptional regulator, peroxide stress response regulator
MTINKLVHQERYETLLQKLRARGARITSHRLAMLNLLADSAGHPSAAQIHITLQKQFPTISLATVYKTLAVLKEEGEVLEINLPLEARYDGNKPYPHPHLICTNCGKILDGDELSAFSKASDEILGRYGFAVAQSQIVFYGKCKDCR